MIATARMVKLPLDAAFSAGSTPTLPTAIIEAINSLVQAAKAKARGYRSTRNLKAIIYLIACKLQLALPA